MAKTNPWGMENSMLQRKAMFRKIFSRKHHVVMRILLNARGAFPLFHITYHYYQRRVQAWLAVIFHSEMGGAAAQEMAQACRNC